VDIDSGGDGADVVVVAWLLARDWLEAVERHGGAGGEAGAARQLMEEVRDLL
jgi:hypothetical protein